MAKLSAEYRFVKPKHDLIIRFPYTKTILPKEGAVVAWIGPNGRYWRRRAKDDSIEVFTEDGCVDFGCVLRTKIRPLMEYVK